MYGLSGSVSMRSTGHLSSKLLELLNSFEDLYSVDEFCRIREKFEQLSGGEDLLDYVGEKRERIFDASVLIELEHTLSKTEFAAIKTLQKSAWRLKVYDTYFNFRNGGCTTKFLRALQRFAQLTTFDIAFGFLATAREQRHSAARKSRAKDASLWKLVDVDKAMTAFREANSVEEEASDVTDYVLYASSHSWLHIHLIMFRE